MQPLQKQNKLKFQDKIEEFWMMIIDHSYLITFFKQQQIDWKIWMFTW